MTEQSETKRARESRERIAECRRWQRQERDAGRIEPRPEHPCARSGCDTIIPGGPGRGRPKKYCSDSCRRAAHRDRQAAAHTATPPPTTTPTLVEILVPRELTYTELVTRAQDDDDVMPMLVDALIDQAKAKTLHPDVVVRLRELARIVLPPTSTMHDTDTAELVAMVHRNHDAMVMLAGGYIHDVKFKLLDWDVYAALMKLARMLLPDAAATTTEQDRAAWEAWSKPGRELMDDLEARFAAGVVVHDADGVARVDGRIYRPGVNPLFAGCPEPGCTQTHRRHPRRPITG